MKDLTCLRTITVRRTSLVRAITGFRRSARLVAIVSFAALLYAPPALAVPLLGSDLASFSVLGATPSVTNTGATTLTGDVGVSPALSITGLITITVNGTNGATLGNPFVHLGDATAATAQGQLTTARTNLGLMGAGTLEPVDLAGLTLFPGVYTVPAGVSNLTGTLTLDGGGDANAFWVFQMPSTLITSPGSVVNVINTGSGAGVFWDVGSSATLDTTTSFAGNILALASITLNNGATNGCGGALANTAAVTMAMNTIGIGCGGGLTVSELGGTPTFLPFVPVPEPETYAMLLAGLGLMGFVARRRKQNAA